MSDADSRVFAFADGLLSIRTPQLRVRLGWRPHPLAEEWLTAKHEWGSFRPEFRVIRPLVAAGRGAVYALDIPVDAEVNSRAEQKAAAFAAFRNEVSPDIAKAVEPFGSHQWALMLAMQRHKPVVDLALANPVLAYALANSDELLGTAPEETVRNIRLKSGLKQREIVNWLGFPDTEAVVRLMRRIAPGAVSPSALRCLRSAVGRGAGLVDLLAHEKVISADMLELVTNCRTLEFVTPKLLQEMGARVAKDGEASVADMIAESIRVLREMDLPVEARPFSTVQQVRRFREEVDKQYQEMLRRREEAKRAAKRAAARAKRAAAAAERRRQDAKLTFPTPPIPGTENIIPLTTALELIQEGEIQSNCVGSYRWLVLEGSSYFYRILEPQRATVLISRAPSGVWRQRELRGTANAAPWPKTVCAVNAWLAEHQVLG